MAIKQIAAQEVVTKMILENRRYLYPFLTALLVDNYLRMAKTLKRVPISKHLNFLF